MNYFSTLSSKGQLTVPQEVRKRLGLETGDRVEFVMEDGRTTIRPARSEVNPFEKFIGIAGNAFPGGEEEIKAWIDDMRNDDDHE
jgi:antitoxin PrlF